jgi:hypothetical protein
VPHDQAQPAEDEVPEQVNHYFQVRLDGVNRLTVTDVWGRRADTTVWRIACIVAAFLSPGRRSPSPRATRTSFNS